MKQIQKNAEQQHKIQQPQPQNISSFLRAQSSLPVTQDKSQTPTLINGNTCFQQIFFTWVYKLLTKCQTQQIIVDSTPALPAQMKAQVQLEKYIQNGKQMLKELGLFSTLLKIFGREISVIIVLCIVVEILYLSYPILIYFNIDYLENHKDNLGYGIGLIIATLTTSFLYTLVYTTLKFRSKSLGVNVSNYVNLLIFYKSLNFSLVANKKFSDADIRGFSEIDTYNLLLGSNFYHFFSGILEVVVGLGLLYWFVGVAFIAGFVTTLIVSIITYFITSYGVKSTEMAFESRDERLTTVGEMLKIIRFIKLNTMEKFFYKKVQEKRQKQLSNFKKKGITETILIFMYYLTAPLLFTSTIITYLMIHGTIDPKIVYTTMMIAVVFQFTTQQLPRTTSQLLSVFKSIQRLNQFFQTPEIDKYNFLHNTNKQQTQFAIRITKGDFFIKGQEKEKQNSGRGQAEANQQDNKQIGDFIARQAQNFPSRRQLQCQLQNAGQKEIQILKNINLKIEHGKLYMIFGDIGSGKSMLLHAILNELNKKEHSSVQVNGKIAFVSQKPWIFSDTVENNIFFTFQKREDLFKEAIKYACLQDDLKQMPKGRKTQIGQNGINLSGGQKFRVDLARSLYSRSDIYLYDDVLSAVDIHVGTFLIQQTIKGFLQGKTVVMATHAIKFADKADYIILMKNGEIVACDKYQNIKQIPQFNQIQNKINKKQQKNKVVNQQIAQRMVEKQILKKKEHLQKYVQQQQQNKDLIQQLMLPEDEQKGQVDVKFFKEYVRLNGGYICFLLPVCLCFFAYSGLLTTGSIILMRWSQDYENDKTSFYIFVGLSITANIFIFIEATILLLSGVKQGKQVHNKITKGLLYASLTNFFNRVPIGRLLNRLGKDLKELDEVIGNTLSSTLIAIFRIVSTIIICIYTSTPYALIPIAIVVVIFAKLRKFYLNGQSKIIRLQKITNSPLVISFTNGIIGATSIRSYNSSDNYLKAHTKYVNNYKQVLFSHYGMECWFIIVLAYLGYVINAFCIVYSMLAESNPASIGLLLTYVLNLNQQIFQFVLDEAQFEAKLISLERLYSIMGLSPEKGYLDYCLNWNEQQEPLNNGGLEGSVQFRDVSARYRLDLPKVLNGVNFKIKAGEKIGIVGRTGSGKTTILNTLIRINELCEGDILVDNEKISEISLKNLRRKITVIDQEPIIINSTFRQNLDVFNEYSDEQISKMIYECNISEMVESRGGLNGVISNDSLSAGEKQLICICRALLKNSCIVFIDEATANIDVKNDQTIQKVIADKFVGKTLMTIAHRLTTLQNSDKIIVMEGGKLLEFGSPRQLEEMKGVYFKMVEKHKQMN